MPTKVPFPLLMHTASPCAAPREDITVDRTMDAHASFGFMPGLRLIYWEEGSLEYVIQCGLAPALGGHGEQQPPLGAWWQPLRQLPDVWNAARKGDTMMCGKDTQISAT